MSKKRRDTYETCSACTHTINIHKADDGACYAYMCQCEEFE